MYFLRFDKFAENYLRSNEKTSKQTKIIKLIDAKPGKYALVTVSVPFLGCVLPY